ncbi:hypothetical protein C8F04DRAFT_1184799 [Mycena alexandri]|uniref:Uncharacterized protein n=1 Tax=Mycena alexandri TaxID=1745969 RepID=A0AAD6X107_9AGAR|nr:hypothetical protein C8F04DRAFT_1184799 [Mycena alexandri]
MGRVSLPRDGINLAVSKDGSRSQPEQQQITHNFGSWGSQNIVQSIYPKIPYGRVHYCIVNGEIAWAFRFTVKHCIPFSARHIKLLQWIWHLNTLFIRSFYGPQRANPFTLILVSAFCAAEFDRSRGANILVMIQNFTAVRDLLAAFGFTQLKKIVVFVNAAGIKVLKASNWADKTFTNKRSKFLNTEMAVKMHWKGVVPDKGSVERKAYNQWQGAVYLWSACGPVVTGCPADAKSTNKLIGAAWSLPQSSGH